jgi:excisionase family DNA binding protein
MSVFTQSFLDELSEKICERLKPELQMFAPPQPPILSDSEELLTSKQSAKVLGVSLPTLHKWKTEGRLKFYRIGTRVRFKRAELISALQTVSNRKGGRNGK